MRFRSLKSEDLTLVSELGICSKASWGYSPDLMKVFSTELTHDSELLEQSLEAIVVCVDDEIVGYFTLSQHGFDIELDNMFVLPEFMRRGVGTAMMSEAIRLARLHKAANLWLIADPHAVGFYEKFQAQQVGEHESSIPGRRIPVMKIVL